MPSPERVARLIKGSLEQVGIKTELVVQPYLQHNASVQRGDHDLALFGWIGDTGDPDNFLFVLFDSENAHGADPQNISFYQEPDVDRMLAQAQATRDDNARSPLYAQIQDQIAADAPWVPIAHSELVVAGRAELEHVIISPTGHPIFPLITRAEHADERRSVGSPRRSRAGDSRAACSARFPGPSRHRRRRRAEACGCAASSSSRWCSPRSCPSSSSPRSRRA